MSTTDLVSPGVRAANRRPANPHREAVRRDRGLTFVELLITVVLMGTVVVAILGASRALVMSSRTNREAATVESALLAVAEQVERAPREGIQCSAQLREVVLAAAERKLGVTAAEAPSYVELGFHHLSGDTWIAGACPTPPGLGETYQAGLVQRIRITLTSPDNGLKRSLEVIKGDV